MSFGYFDALPQETVTDDAGRIIIYSVDQFIKDICEGDCCLICGVSPSAAEFNDEHIIPNWVLRHLRLHDETVRLGNDTSFRYSKYKIACCKQCNERLGVTLESPMRKILTGDHSALMNFAREHGDVDLYRWLGLIFLKVHLRNEGIRISLDSRVDSGTIADNYDWRVFYILHCYVRSPYSGVQFDYEFLGSFLVMPAQTEDVPELFDFCTIYPDAMFLRINSVVMFAIFSDVGMSCGPLGPLLSKIDGPLNELQVWDMFAELVTVNHRIVNKPIFVFSQKLNHQYLVSAVRDKRPALGPESLIYRGSILYRGVKGKFGPKVEINGLYGAAAEEEVGRGHVTFLIGDDGRFHRDSKLMAQLRTKK